MEKNLSDGLPLPQRYGAIATIIIGISMAVLDGAIANVALPTIASDLHASPASSIWIVNAYQIAIVVSLLSFSFLGDMFGYRRVYQCGLVVFTFTSLFCALSDSLHTLTLARIAQGFGSFPSRHGNGCSPLTCRWVSSRSSLPCAFFPLTAPKSACRASTWRAR